MLRKLRVAAIQMESAAGDKPANLAKVADFAHQAAATGAEIVGFPECALTGYWFLRKLSCDALYALAEPVPEGPLTQALLALARDARHIGRRPGRTSAGWQAVQHLRRRDARRQRAMAPQTARVRQRAPQLRRPVHRVRHAAGSAGRRADLLRQQPDRERPHHGH